MKKYRVRFWHQDQDGREDYMEFDTMEEAQAFYHEQNAMAVIQRYNEERNAYEDVVFPILEF